MPIQVLMPQLGESVVEGTLSRWLKAKGERVDEYEPLLEVNTDKVDTEVPSPAAGALLEILVPEGSTVKAGTLLALIGEPGEALAPGEPPVEAAVVAGPAGNGSAGGEGEPAGGAGYAPEMATAPGSLAPGKDRELGFISPVVAKIAGEQGIDLRQVKGTGQAGRITKQDVLAYLEQRGQGQAAAMPFAAPSGAAPAAAAPAQAPVRVPTAPPAPAGLPAPAVGLPGEDEILPLTPVRRSIAEHMVLSKHTSPHVTTVMEVDLSRVAAHRQVHKEAYSREGVNLTYTPYFVSAAVAALKQFPVVNSSWGEDGIHIHRAIHIGMATSLGEAGLIVPVIRGADAYSLLGLARTVNDLAARARARQLKPDEVKGGTFTITNHGTSGSLFATPIINQPQCGILGVGAIQKRVVVTTDPSGGDAIAIRPMAYVSLTFDHRILDGASADHFLAAVVKYLQDWG